MTSPSEGPVQVLVVDDQTLFRMGLVKLLSADSRLEVVGEAGDGAEAVELCEELGPDVVLLDLRMPGMDGLEATRRIAETSRAKVLVLTVLDSDPDVFAALRAGASGYVFKDSEPGAIVSSILAVDLGEYVLASTVVSRMVSVIGSAPAPGVPRESYDGLTKREVEILRMIATGVGNKEIARCLGISDKTVRNHLGHMYEKLGVSGRSQVALYAARQGLVEV